jgi:outer membrane protein assembly factor BamB
MRGLIGARPGLTHRATVVGAALALARPCGAQLPLAARDSIPVQLQSVPDSAAVPPRAASSADSDELHAILQDVPQLPVERVELDVHPRMTFAKISAVTTDRHGNIYIIHRPPEGDPIVVLDPHGNFVRSWGKGLFTMPHGIRIDPDGNVWALDAHSSTIYKFTAEGKKRLEIHVGGVPDSTLAFCGATDIAFAKSGHVFVSDGYCNARVIEYDATGKKLRQWGAQGDGPGEFRVVHSIAMSPNGRLYVADRENGRIEWFDQRGRFLGQWQYGGRLYAIAFGARGELYASVVARGAPAGWANSPDTVFNVIRIDPASGKILGKFAARAHELAVAPDGTLLPATLAGQLILLRPRK